MDMGTCDLVGRYARALAGTWVLLVVGAGCVVVFVWLWLCPACVSWMAGVRSPRSEVDPRAKHRLLCILKVV